MKRELPFLQRPGPLCLSLLLLLPVAGCRLVRTATDIPTQAVQAVIPGKSNEKAVDPVEVQQTLLRFADQFSAGMISGVEKLRHGTNAISPSEVLKWKLIFASQASATVSGSNPRANLLDLTVFVTLARAGLEDYWQPNVYGESAQPLLETCRTSEAEIWRLVGTVLKPEQQAELSQAIAAWRRNHPSPESMLGSRAAGFATEVGKAAPVAKPDSSVFDLIKLDPLASLDPATREIAQMRLFAERALYVAQWMPTLLRWQTELLSLNAMAMPEVQQFLTNSTQLTASVERFARVAEQLPAQVSAEREEVLKALEAQEQKLTPLVNEVRQSLMAGTQMSTSLNTTITTFDALMKRFGVGETNRATSSRTNAEPFRIQDYGQTAVQLEAAARQLTELIKTLDQILGSTNLAKLSAQVSPVVQQAQTGGKELVNYAFWRGVLFVAIVLAAALIYRFLATRMIATGSKPDSK